MIPAEAYEDAARAIDPAAFDRSLPNHDGAVREYRRDQARMKARIALAAALPHLRSLQVETQLEYGRALGRKEAAEEIAAECDKRAASTAALTDFGRNQVSVGLARGYGISAEVARLVGRSQPQNATSEPRTGLSVGHSHPKDSQTAREAL